MINEFDENVQMSEANAKAELSHLREEWLNNTPFCPKINGPCCCAGAVMQDHNGFTTNVAPCILLRWGRIVEQKIWDEKAKAMVNAFIVVGPSCILKEFYETCLPGALE